MRIGIQFSNAGVGWPALRDAGRLVEELGYDWLLMPDHLVSSADVDASYLECWTLLAAWGALTRRVAIGSFVTPATFRHPGIVAKTAVTLDHITRGRAILGIGTGYLESEHAAYGLALGGPRERAARFAEFAAVCRLLLREPRTTFAGSYYRLADAPASPKPIGPLPILVGGDAPSTVRTAARSGDIWNGFGPPERIAAQVERLAREAAAAGRDRAAVLPTVTVRPLVVRDTQAEVDAVIEAVRAANRLPRPDTQYALTGTVAEVADRIVAYSRAGAGGLVVQMRGPFDDVTLHRLAREVRPLVEEKLGRKT